jgi:hypothetical protein
MSVTCVISRASDTSCPVWRLQDLSGQEVSDAREMTHVTLIMFLVVPQEIYLSLIVRPLEVVCEGGAQSS